MTAHNTSAYKDGNKWVVYCVNCGMEEAALQDTSCSQRYVDKHSKENLTNDQKANK